MTLSQWQYDTEKFVLRTEDQLYFFIAFYVWFGEMSMRIYTHELIDRVICREFFFFEIAERKRKQK